jgi:hypothetical protein
VFFGIVNTFGYGIGYFIGFSQAVAYHAISIAYHYNGGKAKSAASFYHLGHALNGYYALLQVDFTGFYRADITY